jgi:hypothetical protein
VESAQGHGLWPTSNQVREVICMRAESATSAAFRVATVHATCGHPLAICGRLTT